jgi:chaperonin GroEL
MLKDIAIATGATVANDESGLRLDTLSLSHLGFASKIISTKDDTTIIGGKGEKHDVDAQITYIKKAIELAKHPYEKEQLEQRLAKLSGGVGIIYVGADSEAELLPLKDSFDDALRATKSALEEGVIVGGGIALLRCIEKLKYITPENEDERQGINLMSIVLQEPFKQMVKNSDVDISVTEILLMDTNFGYNFKTKRIENLFDSGVIDAKKVVRCALQNASSVAGTLLTTEAMIINIEPDNFVNPMLQQR